MYCRYPKYLNLLTAILLAAGILSCSLPTDPDPDDPGTTPPTDTYTDNITTNTTWSAGSVITVDGDISISGAVLTIRPGTVVRMAEDASITVTTGGGIVAEGTADSSITFTGTQPQKGWWEYIRFNDNAVDANCRLKYCIIEYGGGYYSDGYGMVYCSYAFPSIDSCIIRNSADLGVSFYNAGATSFTGNTVTLNNEAPVQINFEYAGTIGKGTYIGNGDDHVIVVNETLSDDATWVCQDVPYLLENGTVGDGAVLTISAGTIIHMGAGAALEIDNGGLVADGTDSIITITGSTPQKGWWEYIRFNNNAVDANCRLKHCIIEYGGGYYSDGYGMVYCSYAFPSIDSCIIRNSADHGVSFYYAGATSFSGNTITLNDEAPVKINFEYAGTIGKGAYAGNDDDHIVVENQTLSDDATWVSQDIPYLLEDGKVSGGAVLTISAGTVIHMDADAALIVDNGGLIADGTDSVITITGATQQKGWWDNIRFNDNAVEADCLLKNCVIEYGGGYYSSDYGMVYCNYANPTLTDCVVRNSDDYGISAYYSAPVLSGITYSGNVAGDFYSR